MPVTWKPPGLIAARYYASDAPVGIIQGPIESGKSVASCLKLYRGICETPRSKGSGIRQSRWLVSRNTYPDLRNSTVNTFLEWFPAGAPGKGFGRFYDTEPYVYEFRYLDCEAEIIFESYADDSEPVLRSLKSKEYTGAWFNELQFAPRKLIAAMVERTGRFPKWDDISHAWRPGGEKYIRIELDEAALARKEGRAPRPMSEVLERIERRWFMGDMNAPRVENHWVQIMRGDIPIPEGLDDGEKRALVKPDDWKFFLQPAALLNDPAAKSGYVINPAAENLANMAPGRYIALTEGRTTKEIKRELQNLVVIDAKGEPVFPKFDAERHVAKTTIKPLEGGIIYGGADFGLTPAWVFGQRIGRKWVFLRELVESNATAAEFAPDVATALAAWFPWIVQGEGFNPDLLRLWGDPSGGWQGQAHRQSVFSVYRSHGMIVRSPAEKDDPALRISASRSVIERYADGEPVLMVDPSCKQLISSWGGGYVLKRVPGTKTNEVLEMVVKNAASHVGEAPQYLLWGGGEARVMEGRKGADDPIGVRPAKVNTLDIRAAARKAPGGKSTLFRFSRKR